MALGYLASAGTSFLQLQAEPGQLTSLLFWTLGSVAGARWETLLVPGVVIVVCVLLLLTRARALSAVSLGDDAAVAVGVDVRRELLVLLVLAALCTAVTVSLAGGERQRVLLARALVQDAAALLLDEPTNHLDARAQLELMELLADLPRTRVAVLHDLDHALAYADQVAVMDGGRLVATGPPGEVLTDQLTGPCSASGRQSCSTR